MKVSDHLAVDAWPELDRFFAAHYSPRYVMRDRRLFDWQFGSPSGYTLVCGWADGRLVGVLGYMPLEVAWGGSLTTGAWMANWMVDPSYRRGTGPLLMRRLQERFPLLLGQGANAANVPIARRLGFRIFDEIPRRVAVFAPEACAALLCKDGEPLPPRWEGAGVSSAELRGGRAALDDYRPDWSRYPAMRFGTIRSSAYLEWRYLDHPAFTYEVAMAGPADAAAVCVWRVETTSGAASVRVGRVVELFHPDGAAGIRAGAAVLGHALERLRSAGCAFADLFCSHAAFLDTARQCGMRPGTGSRLATRLNPVELAPRRQNLEVWAGATLAPVPGLDSLYVTKSDGDQDRPN